MAGVTSTCSSEYAKYDPDDVAIRITVANRGPEAAPLDVLPTLWFRNTWSWGCKHEGCTPSPGFENGGRGEWRVPRDARRLRMADGG